MNTRGITREQLEKVSGKCHGSCLMCNAREVCDIELMAQIILDAMDEEEKK